MIWVGFQRISKNVHVGFVANRPIMASHWTKVLSSICASVQGLAGYRATVEYLRPSGDSIHHDSIDN